MRRSTTLQSLVEAHGSFAFQATAGSDPQQPFVLRPNRQHCSDQNHSPHRRRGAFEWRLTDLGFNPPLQRAGYDSDGGRQSATGRPMAIGMQMKSDVESEENISIFKKFIGWKLRWIFIDVD